MRARLLGNPSWRAGGNRPPSQAGDRAGYPAARHQRAGGGPRGPGVPGASLRRPRGLQAVSGPPFPQLVQSADPARQPEATGGGVYDEGARHGAGPIRPVGPEGLRRRPGAGSPGRRRGEGPPGRGHRFWGKLPPRGKALHAGVPSPSLPGGFTPCSVGARSPPSALCSRFAFQIMLCLAFQ